MIAKMLIFGIFLSVGIGAFTVASQLDGENPNVPSQELSPDAEKCEVVRAVKGFADNAENLERTVKCTCNTGMIAGTVRERPACVAASIFEKHTWCDMNPCLVGETCEVMDDKTGWLCKNDVQTKKVVVQPKEKEEDDEQEDEELH